MDPTLNGLLNSSLQWIFIGGKGGVGKTTTSCSLATMFASTPIAVVEGDGREGEEASVEGGSGHQLAMRTRRVLLISTDPAHNLSDAFNQKIGKTPTPINGVPVPDSLWAMEIDPRAVMDNYGSLSGAFESHATTTGDGRATATATAASSDSSSSPFAAIGSILKNAASTLPGIDELAVFAEILANVQKLRFDVVLFDTAPTGHTLRLLALPQTLNTTIDKLLQLEGLAPLLEAAGTMFAGVASGSGGGGGAAPENPLTSGFLRTTVDRWRDTLQQVQAQFNDSAKTCFVCVCIPEFLSVYETERLIQELMRYNIACDSIVVNQLVLKPATEPPCRMCAARVTVQSKYLAQIEDLYEDFHVVRMPLMSDEVRGPAALQQFGRFLMQPYDPDRDGYLEIKPC